jgi:tetratricopeptide (TPR) repeat protein
LYYDKSNDPELALKNYNRSLKLIKDNTYLAVSNYRNLGNMYFKSAEFPLAAKYYDSTLVKLDKNTREYLQIEKTAEGKSIKNAKQTAEKIKYNVKIENNNLILDNYWITDLANKKHDQEVELYLYLPKGTIFKVDKNFKHFDISENDYFNLHYSSETYTYIVSENKVLCTNCPLDEDDEETNIVNVSSGIFGNNSVETTTTTENDSVEKVSVKVNVNGNEIIRTETKTRTFN